MRCPECNSTITKANYDPEYEWYECASCEGAFTADEILKAEMQKQTTVKAAGKVRRTQIELDEAQEAHVKVPTISRDASVRESKVGVRSGEVINIMADAVEEIYREFHSSIDRVNAHDKALILYREMVLGGNGVQIREKEFSLPSCGQHG